MSVILGYLYLGGKNDAKDKAKLQKLNIKYILNCTPPRTVDREAGCSNFYEKEKLFVYKRIPIFDNKGEDIISHMNTAYSFIEEGKHYGNILVHCHKGISRSASFVIGYLMKKNEFTLEEALTHVQSCRPIVQPNSAFITQLQSYNPHGLSNVIEQTGEAQAIGPDYGPQIPVRSEAVIIEDNSNRSVTNSDNSIENNKKDDIIMIEETVTHIYNNNSDDDDEPSSKRSRTSV